MRIAVSGCRDIELNDRQLWNALRTKSASTILVGDCPTGVDKSVLEWAINQEITLEVFHADWNKYGPAAGPIRNRKMLETADRLVAFWDGESHGTKNAIVTAVKLGLPVTIVPVRGMRAKED